MALIESKSINGTDVVVFDDRPNARKRYKLNGEHVPGVTTFTGGGLPTPEALVNWKIGKAAEYVYDLAMLTDFTFQQHEKEKTVQTAKLAWKKDTDEAAGIGQLVHQYAELCSLGKREEGLKVLSPWRGTEQWDQLMNSVYKVDDFMKENDDEILMTETIVGSTKWKFAGRFDRLVRRKDKRIISDYKTSASFRVSQFVQDAAYSIAILEWLGLEVDGFEVIRFGKAGGEVKSLLIDNPDEMESLRMMALDSRTTFGELKKWNKDPRFAYKKQNEIAPSPVIL